MRYVSFVYQSDVVHLTEFLYFLWILALNGISVFCFSMDTLFVYQSDVVHFTEFLHFPGYWPNFIFVFCFSMDTGVVLQVTLFGIPIRRCSLNRISSFSLDTGLTDSLSFVFL